MNARDMRFECEAILFDLDGVLIDSTDNVEYHWRRWAREHELDEDEVVTMIHGVRAVEVIQRVAPHLDAIEEAKRLSEIEAHDTRRVAEIPGAKDLVRSCPEGRWAVVTSGQKIVATARMQFADIPIPNVLVTADDVSKGKPDPTPYLAGAEGLGIDPERCIVVEDAPAGIKSGHAAGMRVVGVLMSHEREDLAEADAIIDDLSQLQIVGEDSERDGLVVEVRNSQCQ